MLKLARGLIHSCSLYWFLQQPRLSYILLKLFLTSGKDREASTVVQKDHTDGAFFGVFRLDTGKSTIQGFYSILCNIDLGTIFF